MKSLRRLTPEVTSLCVCVWSREEYVSGVHSFPCDDGIRSLNSHFSRCWDGEFREVLIVDLLFKFTVDSLLVERLIFSECMCPVMNSVDRNSVEAECNLKSKRPSSIFNDIGKGPGKAWSQTWCTTTILRSQGKIW